MVAARKGRLPVMRTLLDAKADPNRVDFQKDTALHYAVLGNQPKAVEMLTQHSADVNLKDNFDLTPLMLATRFASLATVKVLIQAKANAAMADENGWSALFFAIPRGDPEIFDAIADQIGEFDAIDSEGDGLVATALEYNQPTLLKKLIDGHAPVEIPNKHGVTPVHLAVRSGNLEALRLMAKNMNVNEPMADGRTPLMVAIDSHQQAAARFFISLNADPSIKDRAGRSSLDHLQHAGLDLSWMQP